MDSINLYLDTQQVSKHNIQQVQTVNKSMVIPRTMQQVDKQK